jgi:hypothetical protein
MPHEFRLLVSRALTFTETRDKLDSYADGTMAVFSTDFRGVGGRSLDRTAPLELFRSSAAFLFGGH